MPAASLFDFRDPLPMPAGAGRLVGQLAEAGARVGLLLGLAAGREVTSSCAGVRRAALVEVGAPGLVWAPLSCGLPDPGLLVLGASDAVALADLVMGGAGRPESRPATTLELELVIDHLLPALQPLAESLADHGVSHLAAGPVSDDPLPAGFGEVVAVPLELQLPVGSVVRVTICLPARTLLPAQASPAAPTPEAVTERVLVEIPVDVALRLPAGTVSAADVEGLAPGDVLRLGPDVTGQLLGVLPARGSSAPVLTASLGRRGRRRAVLVHQLLGGL